MGAEKYNIGNLKLSLFKTIIYYKQQYFSWANIRFFPGRIFDTKADQKILGHLSSGTDTSN